MNRLDEIGSSFNNNLKQSSSKKQSMIKITHKCIGGNILNQFCINIKCQNKNNFICHDSQCQCYENHQFCMKGNIKVVLKKINQKLIENTEKLKSQITKIFSNLINKISQFQQKILKQIQNNLKFSQLIKLQKIFHQIFINQSTQNFQQFNAQKLQNLWKLINKDKNIQNKYSDLFTNYFQQIQKYNKISIQQLQKTNKIINQIIQRNQKGTLSEFQINSSILINDIQLNRLKFLFKKQIKKLNLVFKASQHNFQLIHYYQKCSHLQNTIILCQTGKNKIIGGYTPLIFKPINQKSEYVKDITNSSFVFSLTNNDKFQLKQNIFAIYRKNDQQYIQFGSLFYIYDKADKNTNSKSQLIKQYYKNQKYTDNQQSYIKLNGYQTPKFTVKQWEVFTVEFQ